MSRRNVGTLKRWTSLHKVGRYLSRYRGLHTSLLNGMHLGRSLDLIMSGVERVCRSSAGSPGQEKRPVIIIARRQAESYIVATVPLIKPNHHQGARQTPSLISSDYQYAHTRMWAYVAEAVSPSYYLMVVSMITVVYHSFLDLKRRVIRYLILAGELAGKSQRGNWQDVTYIRAIDR
ncbi:hypothetical protein F5Y10DRAFT_205431 [Nemania abortiva]|nr:hypothetical protein F5Y10DRAFT_205431 [Nemania abortiva]